MAPGVPTTLSFLREPGSSCSPPPPASTLVPPSLGVSRVPGHGSQQGGGWTCDGEGLLHVLCVACSQAMALQPVMCLPSVDRCLVEMSTE